MKRTIRTIAALVALSLVCCCAAGSSLLTDNAVIIGEIPFLAQETYQCGPAALAMVIDYWYGKTNAGKWTTPEEIASSVYSPSARGVLGLDLELHAKKLGFSTEQYTGTMHDLNEKIDQGIPPIILVDNGFSLFKAHHFMVVTGYTPDGLIVNTGTDQNRFLPTEELDRVWKKNDYWTLVLRQ
jgi:predicted double-glycine peptidase